MTPSVYVETTIIGYLAMEPSGVLRIAANQQTTREWWADHRICRRMGYEPRVICTPQELLEIDDEF